MTKIVHPLMTEAEAARYLNRSVQTVRRRRKAGEIAYVRDGGIRYRLEDLDAYIEACRVAATTAPTVKPSFKYRPAKKASVANQAALAGFI